jgi:molybdopterin molybdotransferase
VAAQTMTTPSSHSLSPAPSLSEIAERLQGYDPQALSASHVNDFLAQLVQPVREQETVPLMQAHGRIKALADAAREAGLQF